MKWGSQEQGVRLESLGLATRFSLNVEATGVRRVENNVAGIELPSCSARNKLNPQDPRVHSVVHSGVRGSIETQLSTYPDARLRPEIR